ASQLVATGEYAALVPDANQLHHLYAYAVATNRRFVVGRVAHWSEPHLRAQAARLGPAQADDRVASGAHACQPVEARAPQEVQEHGLGLVVGRMSREDVGGEHGESSLAGALLEVGTRLHGRPFGPEGGPQPGGGG